MSKALQAIFLALPLATILPSPPSYERSESLGSIRLTHSDLLQLITRVQAVLGPAEPTDLIRLKLDNGSSGVTIDDWPTAASIAAAPDVSYQVLFLYQRRNAPISNIVLQLGDFSRTLEVSGSSPGTVDAMSRLIVGDLAAHRSWVGGSSLRLWLAIPFMAAIGGLAIGFLVAMPMIRRLALQFLGWLIVLVGLLAIPPWSRILPGAALYRGSPSPLVRYSAEVSFVGVVLTVGFGIWGVWQSKHRKRGKQRRA